MKEFIALVVCLTISISLPAQNPPTTWTLDLEGQNEIVICDSEFEMTYTIYRFGDGSNPHTYNVRVSVDGQVLRGPDGTNLTLEEESSLVVRGKKITLTREPSVYTPNHIIRGQYFVTGYTSAHLSGPSTSFTVKQDNNPTPIFHLLQKHRVQVRISAIGSITYKPYAVLIVDGAVYQMNGQEYKLQEGNSIDLYARSISVYSRSSPNPLPPGDEFLRGTFAIYSD